MKPVFFSGIFLFFSICSFSQNTETIKWGSKQLEWPDFKGAVDSASPFKALSNIGFSYNYVFSNDSLTVNTATNFKTNTSWTKSTDNYLLLHEQLHFDISEYFRRVFLAKLSKARVNTSNVKNVIDSLYAETKNELRNWQINYDEESDHSVNKAQQEKWTSFINEKLATTSPVTVLRKVVE